VAFPDLLAAVQARRGGEAAVLADVLRELAGVGIVDLRFAPPPLTGGISDRPRAAALALAEAAEGPLVTSQLHRPLKIDDEVARLLLAHLDGTRDRAALGALLAREMLEDRFTLAVEGEAVTSNAPALQGLLARIVDHHLRKLARLALLVA
jgi:hypothetical protein